MTGLLAAAGGCTGNEAMVMIEGAVIGSLIPDIDNKTSTIGKPLFILRPFQGTYDHRSRLPHTFLGCLMFTSIVAVLSSFDPLLVGGFLFGYILHLFVDSYTKQGIRWLYPISKKYYGACKCDMSSPFKRLYKRFVKACDEMEGVKNEQDREHRVCNVCHE
ncbi:hypothetical protein bpr_II388 (plasmid) [Butyrivibrio proteoclasticus B316]|uniref:Inner membrane protein n=2 Tax=Butyrivibrio proteoclasticus TaxID=43305 RepID=E0S4J3_BUTPB|nr:hypothetical protein bpr_II388 [Butyrivibrio proteoclasticus B316]